MLDKSKYTIEMITELNDRLLEICRIYDLNSEFITKFTINGCEITIEYAGYDHNYDHDIFDEVTIEYEWLFLSDEDLRIRFDMQLANKIVLERIDEENRKKQKLVAQEKAERETLAKLLEKYTNSI